MRITGFLTAVAFAAALPLATAAPASAQLYIGIGAPPAMPVYQQPYLANPNYQWIPGYWGYGSAGYYWIPGTWMAAPQYGMLWTPGYWGYQAAQNNYGWNQGYWGRTVGYYGGVNYGGGYYGNGFVGGAWSGNQFRYNTAVMRVNPRYVHNVYVNRTVIVHNPNRYSYFGPGGSRVVATPAQIQYARQTHIGLTPYQRNHINTAAADRNMYARVNNGRPAEVVSAKPLSSTNRPPNFKPVTAADKAAAPKPPANAEKPPVNSTKPAQKPPANTTKPEPKPPANTTKPAPKPPANTAKPAPKPPANATKPAPKPPANTGAAKPPAYNTKPAPKPPVHSAAKPPAHAAPPMHAAPPKPQNGGAKPPQNGGGKPPQNGGGNGNGNGGGKPPR